MTADRLDILRSIPLFSSLTDEELTRILSLCTEETFDPDSLVCQEGERGLAMYVILAGQVRVSTVIPGVGEEALAIMKAGDYFGEMALIDEFPRSATVIAHGETVSLLVLKKDAFQKALSEDKELAWKLLWVLVRTLSARLRETDEKLKAVFALAKSF
jgi:CRP-like cAMP-binding protein